MSNPSQKDPGGPRLENCRPAAPGLPAERAPPEDCWLQAGDAKQTLLGPIQLHQQIAAILVPASRLRVLSIAVGSPAEDVIDQSLAVPTHILIPAGSIPGSCYDLQAVAGQTKTSIQL